MSISNHTYYRITHEVENKTFKINDSPSKPFKYLSVFKTLKMINEILEKRSCNIEYSNKDLYKISVLLKKRFEMKASGLFCRLFNKIIFSFCHIDIPAQVDEEFTSIHNRIGTSLNPHIFSNLVHELPITAVLSFGRLSKDLNEISCKELINRARKYGYMGEQDLVQAIKYIKVLFERLSLFIVNFCPQLQNDDEIDEEKILMHLIEKPYLEDDSGNLIFKSVLCSCEHNKDYLPLIEFFTKTKIDLNMTYNSFGRTALYMGVKHGSIETVGALIIAGAEVNKRTQTDWTVLHQAVHFNTIIKMGIVQMLIDAGVDLDIQDKEHHTALHLAIAYGSAEVIQLLIDAGADLNIRNKDGHTGLHLAVIFGAMEIIKKLIDARAKLNIQDNKRKTALQLAAEKGIAEIYKMLRDAGAEWFGSSTFQVEKFEES
jgi:hypothetical protein